MNQKVEIIYNASETQKGLKLQCRKRLYDPPKKFLTKSTTWRIIHIDDPNHVQYERELKDQKYHINLVHVLHDKKIFFSDETIYRNLMHLTRLFESELR